MVISGAGLAAALPGAVASKTIKPVIGVPVKNNYEGLDSLLSIAQMPPGIPVLAVGVDRAETASINALKILKDYAIVNIITEEQDNDAVKKAIEILQSFNVNYTLSDAPNIDSINLEFNYLDHAQEP